jgi:hypothetical protein
MKRALTLGVVAMAAAAVFASTRQLAAQPATSSPVRFTAAGELMRPDDFREWVFLSAGLGMNYNEPAPGAPPRRAAFTNVFVNPASYREFMKSGKWPEQTMFILEIRGATTEGSINKGGSYQAGLVAVEAEVKDSARFPGGWAYFDFGATRDRVAALPTTASCYTCHKDNGAVEQTFVQFYPSLMEAARKLGTVRASYDAANPHHPQ